MMTAAITTLLNEYVGTIVARSIVGGAASSCGINPEHLAASQIPAFLAALDNGVTAFVAEPVQQREASSRLRALMETRGLLLAGSGGPGAVDGVSPNARMGIDINEEYDIVTARNHTKTICDELGFGASEQVKIATVVSELARNIHAYVGRGRIELEVVNTPRRGIEIRATDQGNGIPNIDEILSGKYRSRTGMGVGLLGTKRRMDGFSIDSGPGRGTKLIVRKYI
jgi:serine/threonine-protein kinase RsbT